MTTVASPAAAGPIGPAAPESANDDPLTARTRAIWTAGDFAAIARGYATGAGLFVDRLALRTGLAVLDVACGAGNLTIPAARTGASVTGLDIAPNLIAAAEADAAAARVRVRFEVGNAEALPFADDAFDVSMSMFGAMFAARPQLVARELFRVTRAGGTVAMANWTPGSFIGTMLRAHVAAAPPPAGAPSPLAWGDPAQVAERLGGGVSVLECSPRSIAFRYPMPPRAVVRLFAEAYGPTIMTLRAAGPERGAVLLAELERLWTEANTVSDGTTVVWSDYLEIVARVR
ncbi:MAG: class I SAM-dependent methyltransferase [Gemmatimonadales bacterium]